MPPEFAQVSVVIPAYRAAATIGRAFAGIAAQTLKPRQVIVVDDGSDDGTFDAAAAWTRRIEGVEVEVVRQDNQGAGAARNRAVALATMPFLAFLDADDEWLPTKLERSMAHMAAGDYVLVAHDGWIVEDGEETLNQCARRFRDGGDPFHSLYRRGYIDTCTVVARRDALVAAGGFDPSLPNGQDFEMWLAMVGDPQVRFLVFDEPLSRYHVTEGGIMSHIERRLECCLRIALGHAPALAGRPGSVHASLWFRVVAVHYEAFTALRKKGRAAAALRTLLGLPWSLLSITFECHFRRHGERGNFLAATDD